MSWLLQIVDPVLNELLKYNLRSSRAEEIYYYFNDHYIDLAIPKKKGEAASMVPEFKPPEVDYRYLTHCVSIIVTGMLIAVIRCND